MIVSEANLGSTEEWSGLAVAYLAQGVIQIRVNLDLQSVDTGKKERMIEFTAIYKKWSLAVVYALIMFKLSSSVPSW